jgi:hypothetical protein
MKGIKRIRNDNKIERAGLHRLQDYADEKRIGKQVLQIRGI